MLLKLLGEAHSAAACWCGSAHEGPYEELSSTSVVATGYGPGDEALASLGIVGPTRMDYPGTMAAVRAVARYVSRILDEARFRGSSLRSSHLNHRNHENSKDCS